ncbi:AAA family ATPase [Amnibacterium endophyticum]|uniref:AAA family ATPase n=1 Tax=Amnibacterium endophyticum TaxID=2109337 RepID=A0ABW4LHD9_9MICO
MTDDRAGARERIAERIVGREHELELVLTAEWGVPFVFVEGNADLTPARLVGHHNPAMVLKQDYGAETFVDGPLVEAMREGAFLYIEEFNRAPEDTLNTLLTAMADRRIAVPRVGVVQAADGFRVVASMNPFDNVGTTRLATSVADRFNRIVIDYQDEEAERAITALRSGIEAGRLVEDAVAVTRATREHEAVRQGSSVRGAIDTALVVHELRALRGIGDGDEEAYRAAVLDGMLVALSGRIHLDDAAEATPEQVLREIWEDRFLLEPARAEPG